MHRRAREDLESYSCSYLQHFWDRLCPLTPSGVLLSLILGLSIVSGPSKGRASHGGRLKIQIRGNQVLEPEVYRAVIDLPPNARADKESAKTARRQVLRFLRRSGYVLAKVRVRPKGDALRVKVDEGRLARVVLRGGGFVHALRTKLALEMPHDIYHKGNLRRQLKAMEKQYGLGSATYQLVPVKKVDHTGLQIEDLDIAHDVLDLQLAGDYELHINFTRVAWRAGWRVSARLGQPDGATFGLGYANRNLVFKDDRWRLRLRGSVNTFENLGRAGSDTTWSRFKAEGQWLTPALSNTLLRPQFVSVVDFQARQRFELDIERYVWGRVELALRLAQHLTEGFEISLGGGYEHRRLYSLDQPIANPIPVQPIAGEWRYFVALNANMVFDLDEIRLDRLHELRAEARYNPGRNQRTAWRVRWDYQRFFAFGWNDLRIASRGTMMGGTILFPEQQSVGGAYLRGVFGGAFYAERAGALMSEYRLSLTRDIFKLGVFADLAAFEHKRADGSEANKVASSLGLGVHTLIASLFQLDVYLGFGFASDRRQDRGIAAKLQKAF